MAEEMRKAHTTSDFQLLEPLEPWRHSRWDPVRQTEQRWTHSRHGNNAIRLHLHPEHPPLKYCKHTGKKNNVGQVDTSGCFPIQSGPNITVQRRVHAEETVKRFHKVKDLLLTRCNHSQNILKWWRFTFIVGSAQGIHELYHCKLCSFVFKMKLNQ